MPAVERPVTVDAWLAAIETGDQLVEVVGGALVSKRVGGNPHHYLARRLAEEFERQWRGVTATAPGNWAVETAGDVIVVGRMPDVLVDGDSLLSDPIFLGVPDAVVEVWSPSNTLGEMNDKRREYRTAGLPVLVEAFLTDSGDVHLEWLIQEGGRWATAGLAVGDTQLSIADPRPFTVVPNALLGRR